MSNPENDLQKQVKGRFKKGQSGNPKGKPQGTRNKATMIAQSLLDGEAKNLTRKVIEQALTGDVMCLRICLERLVPTRKDCPISLPLPEIKETADISRATAAILQAVSAGEITPSEAQALSGVVEGHRKSIETAELEQRLSALESTMEKRR